MDGLVIQVSQFRQPVADEIALRIKLLRLAVRVKQAEVGHGIGAGGRCPLPATVVGR